MSRQWPEFDSGGDLPVGIHRATLADVMRHFGTGTLQRRIVARRLQRIYHLARSTGQLARFVVFGSFVTAKRSPNDVGLFMIMEDSFDSNRLATEAATLFDHLAAHDGEGASIFWIRKVAAIGGEQAALEYWQIKRDQTERGIVEVISNDSE